MSCHLTPTEIHGWSATRLSNSVVEVTVLPAKGADIYSLVDIASGVDVLMKTPWGLQPPGSPPRAGSGQDEFLHNYEGAWQELFPNTGPSCTYQGKKIPMHGEVATLPWTMTVERNEHDCVCISLSVRTHQIPLELTRRMSLSEASPTLRIEETVRNLSNERVSFVWGHHPVLGAPFLEAGCRIHVARCSVHTPAVPFDPVNVSYASAQRSTWPYIQRLDGARVDLRVIPGPEAHTHDHACLTDFERGWIEVENTRLGLAFSLEWDSKIFPWINNWRPLGGSDSPPLEGIYGLAIEPWATRSNLADALPLGEALAIDGNGVLRTSLQARLRSTGRKLGA
jgi:galactose mutarotase-like enzyme